MPWVRKSKKTSSTKKYRSRRRYRTRARLARPTGVVFMKKTAWLTSDGTNQVWNSNNAYAETFHLDQISGDEVAHMTGLFDQYKISGVKVTFHPMQPVNMSMSSGSTYTTVAIPTITYATDNTDANVEQSFQLLERSNAKVRMFNRPVSIYFKPQLSLVADDMNNVQLPYKKSLWLSTDNSRTRYNALKWHVEDGGDNASAVQYRVLVTYYIQLKGQR